MIQRPPFHDPTSCRALQRDTPPPPHPLTLLLRCSYITTYVRTTRSPNEREGKERSPPLADCSVVCLSRFHAVAHKPESRVMSPVAHRPALPAALSCSFCSSGPFLFRFRLGALCLFA